MCGPTVWPFTGTRQLTAAGYRHIGLDHFALPDDVLSKALESKTLHRDFMGYTTHADCDLLGLGVSAISHIGESFSQNHRNLAERPRHSRVV